jgi:hypothetical protein
MGSEASAWPVEVSVGFGAIWKIGPPVADLVFVPLVAITVKPTLVVVVGPGKGASRGLALLSRTVGSDIGVILKLGDFRRAAVFRTSDTVRWMLDGSLRYASRSEEREPGECRSER